MKEKVILFVGESGVGKTNVISSLLHRPYRSEHIETLCCEKHQYTSIIQLWDLPQHCVERYGGDCLNQAHSVVIVTDPFRDDHILLQNLYRVQQRQLPVCVAINKMDQLRYPDKVLESYRDRFPLLSIRGISCKQNELHALHNFLSV